MLEFALGQLRDAGRLVLQTGQTISDLQLDGIDVQRILRQSECGDIVDLSSGSYNFVEKSEDSLIDSTDMEKALHFK
eukprot:SAG31_NODE_14055_length_830_cov_0.588235_2_plen_76_part_01